MEIWFLILFFLSIFLFINSILKHFFFTLMTPTYTLAPGPHSFPIIGNFLLLRKSFHDIELILRAFRTKFGPVFTLRIGSWPAIFIADHSLAHRALVQDSAICANRPPFLTANKVINGNGPTWRMLRRNLTAEILHPSRNKSYSGARRRILDALNSRLASEAISGRPIQVVDAFRYALFYLLVLMCFGDEVEESQIKRLEQVQRELLLNLSRFNVLNLWPRLTKIIFRRLWVERLQLQKNQQDVVIPIIRSRKKMKKEKTSKSKGTYDEENEGALCYVDTLFDLELPDEKRKLDEGEMVILCSEFLNAGTDTTSTALQWIMANMVKYPEIQEKVFVEIKGVVKESSEDVKEEDLEKMPYLRAVVLEGLRRHPPTHFLVPHAVTREMVLDKYVVPKNAVINFMVAEMGWDPKVWEDPMAFKPERFLGETTFDIKGSREIKMMPFGVGRRMCPAYGLATLHLEYFVANLIWKYEWKGVEGEDVDLSEKEEFTVVMKHPLHVYLSPRRVT